MKIHQLAPRFLAALGLMTAIGCFNQPKINGDKLQCMTDDGCLAGYVCTKRPGDTTQGFGNCVKGLTTVVDGSAADFAGGEVNTDGMLTNIDGQLGIDGAPTVDGLIVNLDGPVGIDGSADKPTQSDLATDTPSDGVTNPAADGGTDRNADTIKDGLATATDAPSTDLPLLQPDGLAPDVPISGTGGVAGTGGGGGTGGVSATGGATASGGGATGTGGIIGTGGMVGTGGIVGTGGMVGTGGATGTGGMVGTGGSTGTGGGTTVGHYIVNTDGLTVTDTTTGLVWQRDGAGSRPNCANNPRCTRAEAQAYCAQLTLDGSGWSCPTVAQLQSIVDTTVTSPPTINQTAFPNTPAFFFWTSAPYAGSSGGAWSVYFIDGDTYTKDGASNVCNVRCVR